MSFLLQWLTIVTIMHDIMDSLNYDKLVAFSISLKPLNLLFNAQFKGVFACYVTFQKAFWIPQQTLFFACYRRKLNFHPPPLKALRNKQSVSL